MEYWEAEKDTDYWLSIKLSLERVHAITLNTRNPRFMLRLINVDRPELVKMTTQCAAS